MADYYQPDAMIIGDAMAGIAVATPLRRAGFTIDVPLSGKPRNLLRRAKQVGAQYAVLLGDGVSQVQCIASGLRQEVRNGEITDIVRSCLAYDDRCDYAKVERIYG